MSLEKTYPIPVTVQSSANNNDSTIRDMKSVFDRIVSGDCGLIEKTKTTNRLSISIPYAEDADDREKRKQTYRNYKSRELPAFTPAGTFPIGKRKAQHLMQHSSHVVIDLDHLTEDQITDLLILFQQTPQVRLAFISPSGSGLKVVLHITPTPINDAEHKAAYQACVDYITPLAEEHNFEIDTGGSDCSRLCFLSYHPQAIWNDDAIPLEWDYEVYQEQQLKRKEQLDNRTWTETDMDISALDYINPDCDYQQWLEIGMAIKDAGLDFCVWDDWSRKGAKYDESIMQKKWESFKKSGIGWGTVIYFAKENGYCTKHLKNSNKNRDTSEHHMVKEKKEATGINHPVFPDDVFYGNFQYLYDAYIGKGNYVLDSPFVMAMGLSAVGLVSSRMRYVVAYEGSDVILFPNMYSLIVGSSTYASKSTTRKHLIRLVDNAFMDANVNNDVQLLTSVVSKAGLLEVLDTEGDVDYFDGVTALLHFDELKAMFASMRRDYATDVQSLLNSLWECPVREQNPAKTNKIDAFYPVMNVFGCSTREWLNASVIQDDLGGGFMNRFMPFYSDGRDDYISKPAIDKKSYNTFIGKLKVLTETPFDGRAEKYILNEEAWATWDNYAAKQYADGKKEDTNTGTRRNPHHALKIALAFHIITEPKKQEIGFECINASLALTEYLDDVGTFLYSNVVSDESAKLEQRIFNLLNRKDNSLPKRNIQQSLKDAGYIKVGEVIDKLIQQGLLFRNSENYNIEVQK
ncbi:MAG: hypothetical protein F4039_01405 [Gammaproteobacteria bacterium]|nr:hypothetical protein [Gammaproteobacteria bacterium]MYK42731.1 hypothetical protein [Gammaproteobacteria bacterium]